MDRILQRVEREFEGLKKRRKLSRFRELILKTLYNFTSQVRERLLDIEGRVAETFDEEKGNFYLHTLLLPKSELPVYEDEFQEILKWKREEYNYFDIEGNYNLLIDRIIIFDQVDNVIINGHYIKGEERYNAKFKLVKNNEYLEKVKNLYNLFRANKKQWLPVPLYYMNYVYDVVLVEADEDKVSYEEIDYDVSTYGKSVYRDYVPVWNVFIERSFPKVRVRPLRNRMLYEYDFDKNPEEISLLSMPKGEILHVYRDKKGILKCHGDIKVEYGWELFRIKEKIDWIRYQKEEFPILTNTRKFITKKQDRSFDDMRIIDTKEMETYLKNYINLKEIQIKELRVVNQFSGLYIKSQDSFIKNEFDLKGNRKKVEVRLYLPNNDRALISFALDIMSSFYPEYEMAAILK